MASPDDAIIVDVPPSPRIKRGTGDANQPLELASSDSEDEKSRTPRPAKRTKLASGNRVTGGMRTVGVLQEVHARVVLQEPQALVEAHEAPLGAVPVPLARG